MATKKATRKTKKTLTIHPLETKLEAVKQVNMLMTAGISKYSACRQLAHKHDVRTQTVLYWHNQYNTGLTQVNRNNVKLDTLSATSSFQREDSKFSVHSLSIKTVGGAIVKLTPADIKGIAEYATFV